MNSEVNSINFFDSGTAATSGHSSTSRHSSLGHTSTACCLVYFHHDWVDNSLQFLLFRFELILLCQLVFVKPIETLLDCFFNFLFVTVFKFVLQLLLNECIPHGETIVFQ